jgi:hypothetical protein
MHVQELLDQEVRSLAAGRYARGECRGANIRLRGGDPDSPPSPCSRSAIPRPQKQGCRGAIAGRLRRVLQSCSVQPKFFSYRAVAFARPRLLAVT